MDRLPLEITIIIYDHDSTFRDIINKPLIDLNNISLLYRCH